MLDEILSDLKIAIGKAHEALKRDLGKVRTGRAHAGMLDTIRVDYYGVSTPIGQMATVSVPEARMITVKPWDRSAVKLVEKALRDSDIGLNPQVDGDVIRLPIPPLTEERRKEMVKVARKIGEECKVAIRKCRHEALDMASSVDAEGAASSDDVDRAKKKAEELVSEGIRAVDTIIANKEKDILEV
ncbi:MAG TPA: ribosome recycling factor [Polyangiaceae bacterium]|nr:ribosome recycling factor [Polyangiaceae bacterium]